MIQKIIQFWIPTLLVTLIAGVGGEYIYNNYFKIEHEMQSLTFEDLRKIEKERKDQLEVEKKLQINKENDVAKMKREKETQEAFEYLKECDSKAKKKPDSFYFVLLPLVANDESGQEKLLKETKNTIGSVGFFLKNGYDGIESLEEASARISRRPFVYVLRTREGIRFEYNISTGLRMGEIKNHPKEKSLQLGISVEGGEFEWSTYGYYLGTQKCNFFSFAFFMNAKNK